MIKKLLTLVAAAGLTCGVMAQGTINFSTPNTQPLKVTSDGTTYTTVGASGSALGGGSVRIALLVRPAGGSFQQVALITNSTATSGLFLGTFNGGNPFTLPTQAGFATGNTVDLEFEAWSISTGALDYATALQSNLPNTYAMKVPAILIGYSLGGGATTPPAPFGTGANQLTSLQLQPIPEPSTIALGVLGVAALAFIRRRK